MSKSRMQNLILEVLNAQPSLRDSKQYINSFGPKTPLSQHPNAAAAHNPRAIFRGKQQASPVAAAARTSLPTPPTASQIPQHLQPNTQAGDSHAYPDSQIASTSKTKIVQNSEADAAPKDGTQDYLETTTHPIQQHTALVKVQGPFSRRQLESIADGMVYLKKLGLVSVIVVDGEEWSQPGWASEFGPDGLRIDGIEEQEDKELAPWAGKEAAEARRAMTKELNRRRRVSLRRTMFNDVNALAEMLQERGAPARPFLGPLFRVDATAAQEAEHLAPRHFPGSNGDQSWSRTTAAGVAMHDKQHRQCTHSSAFGYRQMKASPTRSPLISDDNLATLRSALATDHIPIIAPLALYADPEEGYAEKSTPVKADDVLVALARDMAIAGKEAEEAQLQQDHDDSLAGLAAGAMADVDMTPLRLMVINREGGIPSHARGGNPHLAINLASEYSHILHSFVWTGTHPTGLSNLQMVHDCLSYMPHTSSGIVVSHRSPRSLIANLITNKAAHSPSLPHSLLANRKDVRHTPTIIRPGLSINVIQDFSKVDRAKLTMLLESSFRKKLDEDAYYARLEEKCDFVIVTGDYQGAAIVTRESAPGDGPSDEPIAYLDKFAVLPSLQGSGTVDFLWGALRDEVQGLGLLDALNDNGGKGGFGRGRDLVWKSRADNPVNRWYYERSNGFVKVDTTPPEQRASKTPEELQRGRNWVLFWCDAEERLSRMSGERRLRASATAEDVLSSMDDAAAAANFVDWDLDADADAERRVDDDIGLDLDRESAHDHSASSPLPEAYDSPSSSSSHHRRRPTSDALSRARSRAQQTRARSLPLYYDSSRLQELDPRPGGGAGQRLLPVIAPEESGRLERWARCMMYIPSAWK